MKTLTRLAVELALAQGATWLWFLFRAFDSTIPRFMLAVCAVYGLVVFCVWQIVKRRLAGPPLA